MNFHKIIGFLAALLLTLGIGVPDSFAQSISSVTFTIPDNASSVTEGMTTTVAVTVTLDAAPTADVPVTLTAMVGAEVAGVGILTVPSGESSVEGTLMVTPPNDADAMDTRIVVTAEAVGYTPGSAIISVNDDEGVLTVTVSPDAAVTEEMATTVTVTVGLAGSTGSTGTPGAAVTVDMATPVTVTAMVKETGMVIGTTTLTIPAGGSSITSITGDPQADPVVPETHLAFTPPHDMDTDDGNVIFTATLPGYVTVDDEVLVDDNDGQLLIAGVTPMSIVEGNGAQDVVVTVSLSVGTTDDVTVTVTATTEEGFEISQTGSITGNGSPGEVAITVSITPANDTDMEDETLTVTATATGHSSAAPQMVTILDDDKDDLSLSLNPSSIMEGETTTVTVTAALGEPASERTADTEVTVTANLGSISISTTVTVTSTEESNTGTLAIMPPDDTVYMEEPRMIEIIGVSGTGATQITDSVMLTVQDDDGEQELRLTLNPSSITEQDAAQNVTANVTFTLPVEAATMVTVSANVGGQDAMTTITVPAGGKTGSGMLSVMTADANQTDETVVVSAQSGNYSGTANLMVVDDDKPTGMPLTISANISGIRENVRRDVVVTAKLPAAPAAGATVMVTVTAMDGMTSAGSGTITIVGPATEGMATIRIMPNNDNEYTTRDIVVTGSASGYDDGMAMIDVIEDDGTVGEIKISAAPPSVTVGTGSQTVNLTVNVIGQTDTPEGTQVVVNLATTSGSLSPDVVTVTLTNDPNKDPATYRTQTRTGAHRGSATLTVNTGTTVGEVATVTGTAAGYTEGKRTISALSRDAEDVVGYRVVITNRADGAWVPAGDKRVVVEVIRLGGIAAPWTGFVSIAATLKDTSGTEVGDKLTASNFNDDSGMITFTKSGPKGKISYLTTDRLKFEIQVPFHGTINNTNPNAATRRPVNPADNPEGQYMGVYAEVNFVISSTTTTLTNRQTDKPVYPVESVLPSLVPNAGDRYVGDGILVKVDNIKPGVDTQTGLGTNIALLAPVVTSGDESGADIKATVGDELRVAIGIASSGRLFRHAGAQAQLRIRANTAKLMDPAVPISPTIELALKTVNYTPLQIINAARNADSLLATWTVTEGLFIAEVDDFIAGIGPDGTRFGANNAKAYVRARVKDQAGNWSGWRNSPIFDADSRSPSVSILYPSAAPDSMYAHSHSLRFTGATESIVDGQNFDDSLNPLRVVVDEPMSALQVFAVGSDTLDLDETMVVAGDSLAYDTSMLNSTAKDDDGNFKLSSKNRAGTAMELAVLATDLLGNTTKVTIPGVTHDASAPVLSNWFPKNSLIPDGQINDATRHPVLELSEDVDSIAVTFTASNGATVTEEVAGGDTKGETQVMVSDALQHNQTYTMTVFVRDLAGNIYISPADSSSNMRFNSQFDNPIANSYNISASTDSVIAGQANMLTIQAEDYDAESDTKRNALTYKNAVRISAWDADGGVAESVWFEGAGVDDDADNPDGMATLNAADWKIGKRSVTVKSNKAGTIKVLLQHLDSGMDGTEVLGFDSAINLYVGAADFAAFDITAWEAGAEGAVQDIWGDYTLRVVPVDRHGNPSVRAFGANYDSLDVLDTRVGDSGAFEYKNGIDVEIIGVPSIEDFALLILSIGKEGANYDLVAPDNRRTQTVQVRVVNTALKEGDSRSQNIRSSAKFDIAAPLTPVLTLWVPGSDDDEAGNDVVIPADGDVTVTVAAEGFKAGSMVTFTKDGTALDAMEANDDGTAALMIMMSEAGSVTVSATDGRYSTDELTVVFVDTPPEPARKSYADADGNPVYLISDADMTVGVDDFLALVAAFGSSDGDDNYNAQADVNDDGMVDVADFLEFITSFGRTAVGPATKPLVLAPGINENAEFSLSLGSERVVAGEMVAVDVSLANVAALMGYGFALNYETDKFEFVSVAPADEDLLKSTGGETLFHHVVADGQVTVANGLYNGTAVSGGGGVVQFVFRVLREFEDNARFEIADGVVFDPSQLSNPAVVAGVLELQSTPREFALHQNFPNPFNPDTTIKYDLAESADVTLQIYNVLGQVVRTLVVSEAQNAGRYQIRWNGMDDRGVPVSSGIYFYQISADGKFSDVRKLMLLK